MAAEANLDKQDFHHDTILIPAHPKGFSEVFLGEKRWPSLRIDAKKAGDIKFLAVYQTRPISAITHYVEIKSFEPLSRKGRYSVEFKGDPIEIRPVKFTESDTCAIQGPRYANLRSILNAKRLDEAFK